MWKKNHHIEGDLPPPSWGNLSFGQFRWRHDVIFTKTQWHEMKVTYLIWDNCKMYGKMAGEKVSLKIINVEHYIW